jgi:hypothetical protein
MKLNKVLKFTIGAFFALPASFLIGNELLANHVSDRFDYELQNENLLACGGGGGNSPAAKKAKAARKAKVKLSVKKRQLAEAAALGQPTADLQAEIEALEAQIEEN